MITMLLLTLGLQGSVSAPDPKGFVSAFVWTMAQDEFGGWSGIEMSADGTTFVALSDKGRYTEALVQRDAAGVITAIDAGPVTALKSNTDAPLGGLRSDSEDIARAPDGSFYVSFEGVARILRYKTLGGFAENLPTPPEFSRFPRNASLETLAVDAEGTVYTIPEEVSRSKRLRLFTGQPDNSEGGDFPVWRFAKGEWTQPFDLPRRGSFLPVAADFGPDGRIYVLERDFRGITGFASRVRSFTVGPAVLGEGQVVVQTTTGQFDNLEGLSVWRDAGGAIRLTLIADDNFLPFQRTEIVEFSLGN
jgi:hypothetical protein